jgi:hypothetical protein
MIRMMLFVLLTCVSVSCSDSLCESVAKAEQAAAIACDDPIEEGEDARAEWCEAFTRNCSEADQTPIEEYTRCLDQLATCNGDLVEHVSKIFDCTDALAPQLSDECLLVGNN